MNIGVKLLSSMVKIQKSFGVSRNKFLDFPGGPVAKTSCSQGRGPGFDPWSGN